MPRGRPGPPDELRRLGIDARLVWAADQDHAALLMVDTDPANLARLRMWLEPEPAQMDGIKEP